jgi:SAM-dependent methyltransferase
MVEAGRLQVQARLWEAYAESMLDAIGLARGAACVDLACGAMGILGPLSRRAGREGRVVGIDMDQRMLDAAAAYVSAEQLPNVELLNRDALATDLPGASFDLAHARLLIAPFGRADDLLAEMMRLVKPGGVIALEEPDCHSFHLHPRSTAFETLIEVCNTYLLMNGGDPSAGQKIFQLLRRAKLSNVKVRARAEALHDGHPHMRMPLQAVAPLRDGILDALLLTERELDRIMEEVEERIRDPGTYLTTFTLVQAWGIRP